MTDGKRRGRPPKLDSARPSSPLGDALYRVIGELDDIDSVLALGFRITLENPGWLNRANSEGGLSDDQLNLLLSWSGWTDRQRALLIRADHRVRARAGRRRVRLYPQKPVPARSDLVGISALNFDQIVAVSGYTADEPALQPGLMTFSVDEEVSVESEKAFGEELREIEHDHPERFAGGDIYHREHGGSGFNVIRGLAESRLGLRLALVGVSGAAPTSWPRDPRTRLRFQTHKQVVAEAVNCTLVAEDPETGGRCASVVRLNGLRVQRSLRTWPGANSRFAEYVGDVFWDLVDTLETASAVHITSLLDNESPGLLADLVAYVKRRKPELTVSLDPGHIWAAGAEGADKEAIRALLSCSSIVFVSEAEVELLAKSYALAGQGSGSNMGAGGPRMPKEPDHARAVLSAMYGGTGSVVVVKHRGATTVYSNGAEPLELAIEGLRPEQIVDDTGAGDAFAAGYLGTVLTGGMPATAADTGMRLASAKIRTRGQLAAEVVADVFSPVRSLRAAAQSAAGA